MRTKKGREGIKGFGVSSKGSLPGALDFWLFVGKEGGKEHGNYFLDYGVEGLGNEK